MDYRVCVEMLECVQMAERQWIRHSWSIFPGQ
jgi:hypothetical protein